MAADHPEWIITPQELKLEMDKVVLVDVREPEEYAQSRIEGCQLIPLGEIQTRGPQELTKDADTVIYCAHGVRSMHALLALKRLGFTRLRSLEGGICAWQDFTKV